MTTNPTDSEQIASILGFVVDEYLDQRAAGSRPDIETFAERHPDLADLIRGSLRALDVVGEKLNSDDEITGESPAKERKQLGDFRILRELGSGGMGFVYEAEQLSMARHVALKILPMAGALQEKSLQRFRNEVRAASMLDHPHIVSIYSVGEDRGVHYYAMQLIRGQSLARVIEELSRTSDPTRSLTGDSISQILSGGTTKPSARRDDPTDGDTNNDADSSSHPSPVGRPDPQARASTLKTTRGHAQFFRSVARLGIQAADALQHAHDLGVLHRDIKPGNLMLDAGVNLHITDFGLARIETDAGMTLTGDLVGTLRYMSPEQALAKRVVIDHRSDIYSLGMTLYELIALRPAFGASDRQELLKQIAFEEPKRLRKRFRSVPLELSTIIHKAIEKDPQDRYESATKLAEDLQAFLDDRAVRAKPPGPIELARKWSRRHRALVWTASVSALVMLVIAVAMLSISNAMISEERNGKAAALTDRTAALAEKGAALEAKEKALTVADANLQKALDAIDGMLTQVSEQTGSIPELTPLRRDLLSKAVSLCKELLTENPHDERVRFQLAKSHYLLGKIYENLGEPESARQQGRDAASILEVMTKEFPLKGDYAFLLARTYDHLTYHSDTYDEKCERFERAIPLLEKIAAQYPDKHHYKDALMACYCGYARIVGSNSGDHPSALDVIQKAIDLGASNEAEPKGRLGGAYCTKAKQLRKLGRYAEAEQSYLVGIDCLQQHLRLTSDSVQSGELHYRRALSQRLQEYAALLQKLQRHDEAVERYKESIAIAVDIQIEFPAQPWAKRKLSETRGMLLQLLLEQNRLEDAQGLVDQLQSSIDEVGATATRDIAFVYDLVGRDSDAAETYKDAFEQWMLENPADPQLHRTLLHMGYGGEGFRERKLLAHRYAEEAVRRMPNNARCLHTLGVSFYRLDRFKESVECLVRSLELDSSQEICRLDLALSRASVHLQATQFREAAAELSTAIKIIPHGHLFKRRGLAHFHLADFERALSDIAEAVDREPKDVSSLTWISPELIASCPDDAFRDGMAQLADKLLALNESDPLKTRLARAIFFDGLGSHDKAAAEYESAIELYPDSPSLLDKLAWTLATTPDGDLHDPKRAAELALKATKLSPKNPSYWNTLGVAQYRSGEFNDSITTFEKSMDLADGGDAISWFFMSMAYSRLGELEKAHARYRDSVTWMKKHAPENESLISLRAEAEQLLQDRSVEAPVKRLTD